MAHNIMATASAVALAAAEEPAPPGTPRCLTISVPQAGELLGIGRNQAYAAAKTGQLPTIKIGKRVLVPVIALDRMLGIEPKAP